MIPGIRMSRGGTITAQNRWQRIEIQWFRKTKIFCQNQTNQKHYLKSPLSLIIRIASVPKDDSASCRKKRQCVRMRKWLVLVCDHLKIVNAESDHSQLKPTSKIYQWVYTVISTLLHLCHFFHQIYAALRPQDGSPTPMSKNIVPRHSKKGADLDWKLAP